MIPSRIFQLSQRATAARALHTTARVAADPKPVPPHKDPALSQGTERHGAQPETRQKLDAASDQPGKQASHEHKGNPEGVGFAEQVGGASKSDPQAGHGRDAGDEPATPPGFFSAVKEKLGLGTTPEQAKQNRGGGVGVTGAGTRRTFFTSAISGAEGTKGQAPPESRRPKEPAMGEQNAHLRHKQDPAKPDSGKGNAGAQPQLPSHQISSNKPSDKRTFHTSARANAEDTKHTAESYFKDVEDTTATGKTHQVDGSGTGAPVNSNNSVGSGAAYDTVSEKEPYDTKPSEGPEKDQKQRYGNIPGLGAKEQQDGGGDPVSPPESGPEGGTAGGHKPEGRS